jgi:hypothetical protein
MAKILRANCKTALVLRSNSTFAPPFWIRRHQLPLFREVDLTVLSIGWKDRNALNTQESIWIFYTDLLCTYVGQMTTYILYKYQSTYCACKHNLCRYYISIIFAQYIYKWQYTDRDAHNILVLNIYLYLPYTGNNVNHRSLDLYQEKILL